MVFSVTSVNSSIVHLDQVTSSFPNYLFKEIDVQTVLHLLAKKSANQNEESTPTEVTSIKLLYKSASAQRKRIVSQH